MEMREFGVRLTQLRKRLHLSTTQLAAHSGVDYMTVSRYEKGKTLPSLDTAVVLARVLGVTLDFLVTGKDATPPPPPPVFENQALLERMRQLDQLPADRQQMAMRVLDTVITGHALEDLSQRLARS